MVVVDGEGLPLGIHIASASPAEITLLESTLATIRVGHKGPGRPRQKPKRLIADKAYDSDRHRVALRTRGIDLIVPHRRNRSRAKLQDGRKLRRYHRRWKVERTFSWFGSYRRIVVRWDRSVAMFEAFVQLACIMILAKVMKPLLGIRARIWVLAQGRRREPSRLRRERTSAPSSLPSIEEEK